MPCIDGAVKSLYSAYYQLIDEPELASIVSDPDRYFGSGVVTRVAEHNGIDLYNADEELYARDIQATIRSGENISVSRTMDWSFVPLNVLNIHLKRELRNELGQRGLLEYNVDELIEYMKSQPSVLRSIYERQKGGFNDTSMMLYSGPIRSRGRREIVNCPEASAMKMYIMLKCNGLDRTGCLLTGDQNLNREAVKHTLRSFLKPTGTFQMPHHGSYRSFDKNILNHKNSVFITSSGKNNNYGHPSAELVKQILISGSVHVLVDDHSDEPYQEKITF